MIAESVAVDIRLEKEKRRKTINLQGLPEGRKEYKGHESGGQSDNIY